MFLIVFYEHLSVSEEDWWVHIFGVHMRVAQVNILPHTVRGGGCKGEALVRSCGLRGSQQAACLLVPGVSGFRAQVVKIMGPFWIPIIVRYLIFWWFNQKKGSWTYGFGDQGEGSSGFAVREEWFWDDVLGFASLGCRVLGMVVGAPWRHPIVMSPPNIAAPRRS